MLNAPCIIVFTKSGFSARIIASHRPRVPILVLTDVPRTYRQLALVWGVVPELVRHCDRYDQMVRLALEAVQRRELARPGDQGDRHRRRAIRRCGDHEHDQSRNRVARVKLTFLGTGTSFGVPQLGCACDVCRSPDPRDRRTRVGAVVETNGGTRILIDTPPELRTQLIASGINDLDAVLFTHDHADHTHGIDDLRAVTVQRAAPLPMYGSAETVTNLDPKVWLHSSTTPCVRSRVHRSRRGDGTSSRRVSRFQSETRPSRPSRCRTAMSRSLRTALGR